MKKIMKNLDQTRVTYLFEGLTEGVLSADSVKTIRSFLATENLYASAMREIETKLENLNDEFKHTKDRNPIHLIKSRVKTPRSVMDKLRRRGLELSVESARKNLTDIAGVRVICSYVDDIYLIADMLMAQDDIEMKRITDYIKNPKPNGYRSLHLIVTVPVFLSDGKKLVNVEVQIRTIAMDFWASLEHELGYKLADGKTEEVTKELKECADVIARTDIQMQNLYNNIIRAEG